MNDEFDFSAAPKPEDPTMGAQTEQSVLPTEEPAAENAPAEAVAKEAPVQEAPAAPSAQEAPAAPADPYRNPFEQEAARPYPPYPYAQPGMPRPPYAPQPAAPYQPVAPTYTAPQQPYRQPAPYPPAAPTYTAPQQPYQQPAPYQPTYPPQPPYAPYTAPHQAAQAAPAPNKNGGKIALWVLVALLEMVIVGFAVYGVYALAVGSARTPEPYRPSYGDQTPDRPESSREPADRQDGASSEISNYTKVQLGIVCAQMTDEFWEQVGLTPGLVVQSINDDSNAKNTELHEGDVITAANGTPVKMLNELFAVMDKMEPGDEMTLTVYRPLDSEDGYTQGESFTVTFAVKEKGEPASSDYPRA